MHWVLTMCWAMPRQHLTSSSQKPSEAVTLIILLSRPGDWGSERCSDLPSERSHSVSVDRPDFAPRHSGPCFPGWQSDLRSTFLVFQEGTGHRGAVGGHCARPTGDASVMATPPADLFLFTWFPRSDTRCWHLITVHIFNCSERSFL